MTEALTNNLRLELEKTSSAFNRWTEQSLDDLASRRAIFDQNIEEYEHMFAALKKNDSDLEDARTYNMQLKADQQKEIEHYVQETERLKKQMRTWEHDLTKYNMEEEQEVERLDKIREDYERMREKMEQKLNDLRYGVKLYAALGLTFDKADSAGMDGEGAGMAFRFTQISRADPTREFMFKIKVNERDEYELLETEPALASTLCAMYLERLNKDNNIGRFVCTMRKAFKALV